MITCIELYNVTSASNARILKMRFIYFPRQHLKRRSSRTDCYVNEALCIGISSVPGHLYHLPALLSCIRGVSVQYRMSSWRLVTNRVDTDSGNLRPALTVWSEIWSLIQILCGISNTQFLWFWNTSIDSTTYILAQMPTHKVNSSHFCGLEALFGQRRINISWPRRLDTERVLVDKVLTKGLSLSLTEFWFFHFSYNMPY